MVTSKTYITKSRDETIKLGQKISKGLKPGDVVALIGDLGSGKTTLVKGIAKGLGVKNARYVNSPSFVIIKEYEGKLPLYHFDAYRFDAPRDIDSLECEEYFYAEGISVVEWADKIPALLPEKYVEVKITAVKENERTIKISSFPYLSQKERT